MIEGSSARARTPSLNIDTAAYVISLDPRRSIVRDSAVAIDADCISRIAEPFALRDVPTEQTRDTNGCMAVPALVNGHVHISRTSCRVWACLRHG
jgi:cytosine/adenosine deaminase-related metal-dependent hydrolase